MNLPPMHRWPLLALVSAVLAACSGGEVVGVHLRLDKDGSGLLTTRALVQPRDDGGSEVRVSGVTWTGRAALVCRQGRFQRIQDVALAGGGVRFSTPGADDRPSLRIYLQRGPAAEWVKALVPDEATRRTMAGVYDPTDKTKQIGDTLRIELSLPSDVITSGVLPTGRGVEAAREGRRAYLLLPVRSALEDTEELVWDISWK